MSAQPTRPSKNLLSVAVQQKWVTNALACRGAKFGIRSPAGRRQQMVRHHGGRWDVSTKDDAVYVERIAEGDERLFDDSLSSEEARELAGLLTKYADKLDESEDSGKTDEPDDPEESEDSDKSDKSSD